MKFKLLAFIASVFLISSCVSLRNENIKYNSEKELYEYRFNKKYSVTLRNEHQQLVDSSNYNEFQSELLYLKNRYPFKKRIENDFLLKKSDHELSSLYAQINQSILDGDFQKAINDIDKISTIYKDIYNYSDCYYFKGYAFEKLGLNDSATANYNNFLQFSSRKYSARFRGYRDNDLNDSLLISERKYAKNYLLSQNLEQDLHQNQTDNFNVIKPKYYFGSFQPGYNLNSEDLTTNSKGIIMLFLGNDFANELSFGAQFYTKLNKYIDVNPKWSTSGNTHELDLAMPIQVYKSENNNFGLKITPFLEYINVDSVKIDNNKYQFDESILNFGGQISVGYYPIHNFAIGAYYQYNFYNENNKATDSNSPIEIWFINEYDLSCYYNIYKGLSLKAGIKNSDFVAGLVLSGWEISYNVSSPGIILRADLY